MNFLILGNTITISEFTQKILKNEISSSNLFELTFRNNHYSIIDVEKDAGNDVPNITGNDVIFDLTFNHFLVDKLLLEINEEQIIFFNSTKTTLLSLKSYFPKLKNEIYGINGLPSFLGMEKLEISSLETQDFSNLTKIMDALDQKYLVVKDRVGMITPRVICMIINEAYYTLQEGIANIDDIDKSMKLGTNYPYGPFEWSEKVGIKHVYEVLNAIYEDTKDERYKICPLLKSKYLLNVS